MKDVDIMAVLIDWHKADFTQKEFRFIVQCAGILAKEKTLTPAQHQWLQSIYDKVIAFRFGLEKMSTDQEYAAKKAILRKKIAGKII